MKQNKDEELQSRRSFFKNAAKAVLPVIGAQAENAVHLLKWLAPSVKSSGV